MPSSYPDWRYFPASSPPPEWVGPLVGLFAKHRAEIESKVVHGQAMQSDDVLRVLAADLEKELDFEVEKDKTALGKLARPVLFRDRGTFLRTYEIDAFEPANGIALEVEAGRATMGNAIYRDLIQASLIVDAKFLALAVPVEYRYGKRPTRERPTRSSRPYMGVRG